MSEEWIGAHLHLGGPIYYGAGDRAALEVVAPFVDRCRERGWTREYFFIRYGEGGPHLRLRLRVPRELADTVATALCDLVRDVAPSADIRTPGDERTATALPTTENSGSAVTALRWVAYEPEFARYGGPEAIRIAHRVFETSSDAALALLSDLGTRPRDARLGRGLLLMLATIHAFVERQEMAAPFAASYTAGYLRTVARGADAQTGLQQAFERGFARQTDQLLARVEKVWRALDDGDEIAPIDRFVEEFREHRAALHKQFALGKVVLGERPARTWADCVDAILPSYLHMTNNRLGISIPEEAYLAHMISRSLDGSQRAETETVA